MGTPELRARRAAIVGGANVTLWDGSRMHAAYLAGFLTEAELVAGRRFAALAKLYLGYLSAPNPDRGPAHGPLGVMTPHASGPEPDREEGEAPLQTAASLPRRFDDPEEYRRVKDRYANAYCALGGHREKRAVAKLTRDEPACLTTAKRGLGRLAVHWRLLEADGYRAPAEARPGETRSGETRLQQAASPQDSGGIHTKENTSKQKLEKN
ncbi:MAG: hypothetical protein QNJ84_18915 [Alphaproteobacteria bacterium]|nr:hypothetical protein [Alphaproteobacteria bacterium]